MLKRWLFFHFIIKEKNYDDSIVLQCCFSCYRTECIDLLHAAVFLEIARLAGFMLDASVGNYVSELNASPLYCIIDKLISMMQDRYFLYLSNVTFVKHPSNINPNRRTRTQADSTKRCQYDYVNSQNRRTKRLTIWST